MYVYILKTLLFRVSYKAHFSQQHVVHFLYRVRTVCNPFKNVCYLWVTVLFMIISVPHFMHPRHFQFCQCNLIFYSVIGNSFYLKGFIMSFCLFSIYFFPRIFH